MYRSVIGFWSTAETPITCLIGAAGRHPLLPGNRVSSPQGQHPRGHEHLGGTHGPAKAGGAGRRLGPLKIPRCSPIIAGTGKRSSTSCACVHGGVIHDRPNG
jgi:hypothetical protein